MTSVQRWPVANELFRIDGDIALVTGAGAGIGRAIATMLAAGGAAVVAVDRDGATAEATAAFIAGNGGRALGIGADITDDSDTKRLFGVLIDRFGKLDILVNNAGIYPPLPPLPEVDWESFRRTFEVNFFATVRYVSEAARRMQPGGRIINLSSIVSQRYGPSHYASSKGAVNSFTRSAAVDLATRGIRVNAILPGVIVTEGTTALGDGFERFAERVPAKRVGNPDEIGSVALFLASPAASYINGQCICVDGGTTIL